MNFIATGNKGSVLEAESKILIDCYLLGEQQDIPDRDEPYEPIMSTFSWCEL